MKPVPVFGAALKALRLSRGLSQQSFATVATREHISRLERGQSIPNLKLVCDLAAILDVHPLSLLTLAFTSEEDGQGLDEAWRRVWLDLHSPGVSSVSTSTK